MIVGIETRLTLPSVHASQSVELIYLAREESIDHEVINFIPILPFSFFFFMNPSSRMEKSGKSSESRFKAIIAYVRLIKSYNYTADFML